MFACADDFDCFSSTVFCVSAAFLFPDRRADILPSTTFHLESFPKNRLHKRDFRRVLRHTNRCREYDRRHASFLRRVRQPKPCCRCRADFREFLSAANCRADADRSKVRPEHKAHRRAENRDLSPVEFVCASPPLKVEARRSTLNNPNRHQLKISNVGEFPSEVFRRSFRVLHLILIHRKISARH